MTTEQNTGRLSGKVAIATRASRALAKQPGDGVGFLARDVTDGVQCETAVAAAAVILASDDSRYMSKTRAVISISTDPMFSRPNLAVILILPVIPAN